MIKLNATETYDINPYIHKHVTLWIDDNLVIKNLTANRINANKVIADSIEADNLQFVAIYDPIGNESTSFEDIKYALNSHYNIKLRNLDGVQNDILIPFTGNGYRSNEYGDLIEYIVFQNAGSEEYYSIDETNHWEVFTYSSTGVSKQIESGVIPATGLEPGILYVLGSITADPHITLHSIVNGLENEYKVQFTIGSGWTPAVTFPASVVFPDTPTWEVGKTYQVSIVNNLALVAAWTEE